jgi:hypothetical protein
MKLLNQRSKVVRPTIRQYSRNWVLKEAGKGYADGNGHSVSIADWLQRSRAGQPQIGVSTDQKQTSAIADLLETERAKTKKQGAGTK